MAEAQYLNPSEISDPGGRYTQMVRVGDVVYISGQTAGDKDGNIVGKGDPLAQARQVFANLGAAIRSVGGKPSDIIKTTTYVLDRDYVAAVREARQEFFPQNPPTSTMVVVSGLANPDFLLEIEGVAHLQS